MILTNEDQLRVECEDVLPEEVNELRSKLEKELQLSAIAGFPGIGLAAPQIGEAKNMAIIRLGDHKIDLVNAKIVNSYDKFKFEGEGCLSFPNRTETTMRYFEIEVENEVEPKRFTATGLLSVAIQHELNHIEGVLLPDLAIKKKEKQSKKIRPNDLCPCGSNKKYKKCCKK